MLFICWYMLLTVVESLSLRRARSYSRLCSNVRTSAGSSISIGDDTPRTTNSSILGKDISIQKQRFWTQFFTVDKDITYSDVQGFVSKVNDERFIHLGIGLVCSDGGMRMMPIHEGKIQQQHVVDIPIPSSLSSSPPVSTSSLVVCGFRPRATQVQESMNEDDDISTLNNERPINHERLQALDKALITIDSVLGSELMTELSSSTPGRIYRSFIAPRKNSAPIVEDSPLYIERHRPKLSPLERAALRTANQIEQAMRQVRADRAEYLRNNDKPLPIHAPGVTGVDLAVDSKNGVINNRVVNPIMIVLDNLRSAYNVGSIFRSADTAGVAGIITCGICPKTDNPKLRKTGMSAVDTVPSKHYDNSLMAIQDLKDGGYKIAVMETTEKSCVYSDYKFPKNVALVVGNELTGIDPRIIEIADAVVEIPTFGIKNSLNVASALPVVLFEVLRQWR